jgi:hypothetical protein
MELSIEDGVGFIESRDIVSEYLMVVDITVGVPHLNHACIVVEHI